MSADQNLIDLSEEEFFGGILFASERYHREFAKKSPDEAVLAEYKKKIIGAARAYANKIRFLSRNL